MAVMGTVLGFVADIGLDAAKERFKLKQDEFQARAKLMDYLARQQKYNFNCSLEEEIDFEGLAEYIRSFMWRFIFQRKLQWKTIEYWIVSIR